MQLEFRSRSKVHVGSRDHLPNVDDPDFVRRFFALSERDLIEVHACRGAANKIAFAIQLCTLRWFGFFVPDMARVPKAVLEAITKQLNIETNVDLSGYPQSADTWTEHPDRIRKYLGFSKCDELQRLKLLNYLTDQALQMSKTTALTDLACEWLYAQRIARPATRTIKEICGTATETAMDRIYTVISNPLTPEQRDRIDELLKL
jgi:TnpA family transposase